MPKSRSVRDSSFAHSNSADDAVSLTVKEAGAPIARQIRRKFKHLRCVKPNEMKKLNTVFTYDADGNTSVRWYAYYYLPGENGAKKKRVREYGGINEEKDPTERKKLLEALVNEIHFTRRHFSGLPEKIARDQELTCEFLIKIYLIEKKASLRTRAYISYKRVLDHFQKYLNIHDLDKVTPDQIDKNVFNSYKMFRLASGVKNRTVNNHLNFIKTFFNWVHEEYMEVMPINHSRKIKPLPSRSESHIAYTDDEARKISAYLKENYPETHLYTKFVVYPFLRPNEIEGLRIGDLDLENKKLLLTADSHKTSKRTHRPLPEIFIKELRESGIMDFPKDFFIFGKTGGPGPKKMTIRPFRIRFKRMKDALGFSDKHTMYGLRHTFVCQLLRNGMSPIEVMKYTGHTTLEAFSKYATSIMQGEAEDISHKYSVHY